MQPWRHAMMTARTHDADWADHLAIHEFIDAAKTACPDLRHRVVLHNGDLGVALAKLAFPERPDCEQIVQQHIKQDIGSVPRLVDWMASASQPVRLKWRAPDDEDIIRQACEKCSLEDDAPVRAVMSILTMGIEFTVGDEIFGRAILMNNFGPALVRRLLGPARLVTGAAGVDIVFDPAWIAEGIIAANFGCIPMLDKVLAPFSGKYSPS